MDAYANRPGGEAVPQTLAADLPAELPANPEHTVLLDVREDDEWAAGHAPGAVHIPLAQLPGRAGEVTTPGGAQQVVVVCKVGARSQQAAMFLAASGVPAVNVADGMLGWARAGRPMVSETGADPAVI